MISEEQEIQMGREYNSQILKMNPIYQDQELQEYVQSIGESLALKSSININAEDQLRLINGDYPDKTLKAGRLIKLVQ